MNLIKSIITSALLMMLISVPAFTRDVNSELIEAAMDGQTDRVKSLLADGADVNFRDGDGDTAWTIAACWVPWETGLVLLDAGADVNATSRDGGTALMCAAMEGHIQKLKALLASGADVEAKDNDGWTSLMWAIDEGTEIILQILLDAGADVEAKDNDGGTSLIIAAANGETEIVQALVEAGADVNVKTSEGMSALIAAEAKNYPEIAELLRTAGANWGQEEIDFVTELNSPEYIMSENESLAVSDVRNLVVSHITYSATVGEGKYAKNLVELEEARYIDSQLASGMKNGYQFATSSEGETFKVNADPIMPGETGIRSFFVDESGVIRWSMEGPATVFSLPLGESEPDAE